MLLLLSLLSVAIVPPMLVRAAGTDGLACGAIMAHINAKVERWHFEKGSWPKDDLSDMEADPRYFAAGVPRCPVTGQLYRLDPRTHRVKGHDH